MLTMISKVAGIVTPEMRKRMIDSLIFLCAALVGFYAGFITGREGNEEPKLITVQGEGIHTPEIGVKGSALGATTVATSGPGTIITTISPQPIASSFGTTSDIKRRAASRTEGKYVGSRNSNKYYPPTCSYAKRISPENQLWFESEEEAKAAGYVSVKVSKGCRY
ncbi:MAG: hypothetical protein HY459_00445 [Parcubacteria group bacterium]|nr:hypothetical protein [Parcubacteria group bacterium]